MALSSSHNKNKSTSGLHYMAPGCANSFYRNPRVSFHRLQASEFRLRQWLQAMKRKDVPVVPGCVVIILRTATTHITEGSFNTGGSFENKKTYQLNNGACHSMFDFSSYTQRRILMTDSPPTSVKSRERGMRREKEMKARWVLFKSKHWLPRELNTVVTSNICTVWRGV